MNPEITFIRKCGPNPLLSKRLFLDDQGALKRDGSACVMIEGTATRASAATASALAGHITRCGSDQAIALGAMKADLANPATITVQRKLAETPGAIARSREFIDYRPGVCGWALIDFDTKGVPPNVTASIEAAGGMWPALLGVAPGLQRAARVSRASTSAGLFRSDTDAPLSVGGGAHHYVLVKDGGDIERFLHDLHDRCWLHGFGWHVIGGAGQLLERSLVDRMVGYGERLCFEGPPLVLPPLAQDAAARIPEAFEGEAIDAGLVVPKLTEYERHRVAEAKATSAESLGNVAAEIRLRHDRTLAGKISATSGMPLISALRLVSARHRGVLLPYLELEFDHLGVVPVATVLADPERFVGETLADPLEGVAYGRGKAKVMRANNGGLFIHSFAHGRSLYSLAHDAWSAKAAIAHALPDGVVDFAMTILANAELEADELVDFVRTVAQIAKTNIRAVNARIAKARREQEQVRRNAASDFTADNRLVRPRPKPDGELTPTVTFLDQVLAADPSEEPPMRDASGNLVDVRVREPWNLHLLTADGSYDDTNDIDTMKPPAEPGLVQLTPTRVELLIERYVRWSVQKRDARYFGALPRPFVDALMQLSPSAVPIARAINTAPLIAMSGNVIDGVGLDRGTGLVHRIDPLLRACLPVDPLSERDVRAAVTFLFDEWLVDVALDRVGKSLAIMLAMTLIERALLPERPAFFVTAGQRGGGKTTLVNMITLAVFGRPATAAAWSDNAEERKKALFSYLRQGVASLAWDNIARGASISCPHIEAALTANEISDRVLGISRVETVSSTTVQIFTGNSIAPRGDMASRSLTLALSVDRPDPENRPFVHADPSAWTLANRPKIVRALYTLLLAGTRNRPKTQEAKTRFKTWWKLVGWPMEYAASLVGTTVNCTELMRAGEIGDEEASAASAALTVFREIWGTRAFTARDVVKMMTPETRGGESFRFATTADEDKALADAIGDALGELAGKRLDRPTARSIGKLFQKRLAGRPAWIGDGQTVATLQKSAGHAENTYRIDVSAPAQSPDTPPAETVATGDAGPEHSPHSQHSPWLCRDGDEAGKDGKEGKVLAAAAEAEVDSVDANRTAPKWGARL